jgi:hypothetical protein
MIDLLKKLFDSVSNFFTALWDWLWDGLYDLIVWAFAGLVEYLTLASIEFAIWAVGFAWDVAKQILQDLNFSSYLASAWSALPPEASGILTLLKIPEVLTILASAVVTKYVLRFIPFV